MSEQGTGVSSLTQGDWTCMVCHDKRPFTHVGVAHRPLLGSEDGFPGTRVNVRYCLDREECATAANADGPWDPADAPLAEEVPDDDRDA